MAIQVFLCFVCTFYVRMPQSVIGLLQMTLKKLWCYMTINTKRTKRERIIFLASSNHRIEKFGPNINPFSPYNKNFRYSKMLTLYGGCGKRSRHTLRISVPLRLHLRCLRDTIFFNIFTNCDGGIKNGGLFEKWSTYSWDYVKWIKIISA